MNLRDQIEARRDELIDKVSAPGVGAGRFSTYTHGEIYGLGWVLDLLDAQPAAVSLPEEAEPWHACVSAGTRWSQKEDVFGYQVVCACGWEHVDPIHALPAIDAFGEHRAALAVSLELPEPPQQPRCTCTLTSGRHELHCAMFRTEPPIEDAGSGGVR